MRKFVVLIISAVLLFALVSCAPNEKAGNTKVVGSPDVSPTTSQEANTGTLADSGFAKCAKDTFLEIGIEADTDNFSITRDEETSGVRSVWAETTHDGIEMKFSCICVDGEWSPVSILDEKADKYFFVYGSSAKYKDIYDWKTGELVSAKTADIPDSIGGK